MINLKTILLLWVSFIYFSASAQSATERFNANKLLNSNVCPPNYLFGGNGGLTGIINDTQFYETDGGIESTQTIAETAIVEYDSKVKITLSSGFNTINGATFSAYIDGCDSQCDEVVYDGSVLAINSAFILEFGINNFSDNHYEYYLVVSDGIYNGGNQYIGGTYSLTIELLSLGNSFNYGEFHSCFFCGNETNYSFVGHLFLIEDTNDDDLIDFNTDPFYNGDEGFVRINDIGNNLTELKIDFILDNGKTLKGCYTGQFTFDP